MVSGAVYIYLKDSSGVWSYHSKLEAPDGEAGDGFGFSVSLSDTFALVSSIWNDDTGYDAGDCVILCVDT